MAIKKDEYATDLSPQLRRSAAMYAPITNYMQGNDAAAAKLVTNRLQRSGAPMPSTVGPPAPAVAQPPGMLQRMAPSSAANIAYGTTARPGESVPEMIGRGTTGALGMLTAVPEALARSVWTVAGGAKDAAAGVIRGATGAPVAPPQTPIPAPAPTAPPPAQPIARPPSSAGVVASPLDRPGFLPAPTQAAAPAQDLTMLGPVKRAQQPGEAGRSVSGRQLPGAPTVGADGSIVYDQAFMDRNQPLIAQYQQQNVVPTVVPPPGVAASTATGGNMPSGPLTRRPAGFTAADRAAQLDALDRLGRSNAETKVRDAMGRAAARGDAAAVAQLAGATSALASPPLEPMRRGMAESGARLGMDQARLSMEQDKARMDAEAQGVDTRARGLQLKQAEQMQALTQQLLQGTPEEKQAAAQSLAAMQGTKPGQPIKVSVPIGTDEFGKPATADGLWQDGKLVFDPRERNDVLPLDEAIKALRAADTPENRRFFKETYGQDPAQFMGQ